MLAGVTIVDPASTWIEAGVEIEPDVTIHPFTVIRGDVRIASGAEIGPFAYLRPGTVVGEGAKIGTFVEVKKSHVGARTKIPHLSYIGDAEIGEDTNIARREQSPPISSTSRATRSSGRRSAATSGPASTIRSMLLSSIGDDAWIAAGCGHHR